jgi:Predicted membrane protein
MNKTHLATLLTMLSAFVIGLLDVYGILAHEGSVISAQTGNLVNLALSLAQGDFAALPSHLALLLGFAAGCILPVFLVKSWFKNKSQWTLWTVFTMMVWIRVLFGTSLSTNASLVDLSFIAGLALSFFRNLRTSNLNNGIMTGNLKNMYGAFIEAIVYKQRQKYPEAFNLLLVIVCFFAGALIGGWVAKIALVWVLVASGVSCLLPYLVIFKKTTEES